MNRKINVVPQSLGGIRTVANKLPDSHLSKVPLDKLLSYANNTGMKNLTRLSDLQSSNTRTHNGPGSLFDTSTTKVSLPGDAGKSPIKMTPMKSSNNKKSEYSSSSGAPFYGNMSRGIKDETIEERRGETSRSNSIDEEEEKSPASSSSEDTPSVGDEGKSAGATEEDDLFTSSDIQT